MTLERWDALPDGERAWWLERHRVEQETHSCGHPREVCSDAEQEWFPQLSVCYVQQEQAAAQWRYDQLREKRGEFHDGTRSSWSSERSSKHPYHYMDGATVWVAEKDLGLGGDFLGSAQRVEPEVGHGEG